MADHCHAANLRVKVVPIPQTKKKAYSHSHATLPVSRATLFIADWTGLDKISAPAAARANSRRNVNFPTSNYTVLAHVFVVSTSEKHIPDQSGPTTGKERVGEGRGVLEISRAIVL